MNASAALMLLKGIDLLMLSIEVAPNIRLAFAGVSDAMKVIVSEGRDPNSYEWAKLDELRDQVHLAIQGS